MPDVWGQAAVVDAGSLRPSGDDGVVLHVDQRYAELPESGWGALVGWLAGASRLLSCPDSLSAHVTETTTERGPAVTAALTRRSAEEQDLIEEDVNAYLEAAGADPRSPGRRWFVRLPDGVSADELWETLNEAVEQAPRHPSALPAPLRRALVGLYGD